MGQVMRLSLAPDPSPPTLYPELRFCSPLAASSFYPSSSSPKTETTTQHLLMLFFCSRIPHSNRAFQHIHTLAQKHPHTKFVSIVGDKCIPNLPDTRLPMFIIYRRGEVLNQIVAWGAGRERGVEGRSSCPSIRVQVTSVFLL